MNFIEYFKEGFVVGYVVSVGFVTASLMSYYYLIWLNLKQRRRNKAKVFPFRNTIQFLTNKPHIHDQISELQWRTTRMSFEEISKATNEFSKDNIIGLGRMGTTYKAMLQNGCLLAVKRLHHASQQLFKKHFICEIKSIGRLRHNNLVPLLGFCIKGVERILVYKYMSNGNLYDWLHPREEDKAIAAMTVEWALRLKIAVGVARGLAWLHHHSSFLLAHLDITSRSILLNQNFEPKISNYSRAVLMNSNDPDSSRTWELDLVKSDVYCFGLSLE
ncbi:probably inactive leucine-rich repeat receptor-like protein kinase At5g48380 [Morus notabilis]|uniref:probably inactive leucine-rich repeat receptor-like protein kinase At5g48380 n=1 Tax=Morus notabilis TaxID=981085 RepID=UPI000CED3352|nr:probably inactive leucine-rich repeat receptor-like protein kinase At5g48380 [Morus notabilis]